MTRTILLLCLAHSLAGQSFEVASIKPHPGMVSRSGLSFKGTRVTVETMNMESLLAFAYDLKGFQITGGPEWVKSEHWDITAKAEGDAVLTEKQVKQMTQTLLAERYALKLHRATAELPVYLLSVAKGGPKLKESSPDARYLLNIRGGRTMEITATKSSIPHLVDQLSGNLDRPVLDKTGLTGNYDYKMEWATDPASEADSNAPSIFTAAQEELGLKLEPKKAPVEVLVIDQVTKPSEN
jgi:uncharacterized protein (TIGR03435 family)